MQKHFYFLFLSILSQQTFASFCGSTGVPFSFEVLPSGAPILGCAQPTCIASLKSKKDDSNFLVNANGQADGFMREDDKDSKAYSDPYSNKLIANCSNQFSDLSCLRKDQWVGGIEYIDHPRQPLILQCCTFPGLRFSQEVGVTNVGPGEAITGGEVIRDGRQISFDVIANARKVVDANTHIVSYEVTVRRMHCLPDPPEPVISFEKDVSDEIVKVLTKGTDLSSFRREKMFRKEKLEDLQSNKAFTDTIARKTNEKKQYKKAEFEDKESFKTVVENKNEAIQKLDEIDARREITPKLDIPFGNYKSETDDLRDAGGSFSNENSLGFANRQVVQTESKAFGQPQLNVFGQQVQQTSQLPLQQPGFGFGTVQQQVPGQIFQPGQSPNNNAPCPLCQQTPCFMQRCNQGLDPVLGIPTLFPLSFPTLPGFPTLAPQTFQPFLTQTYPTIAPLSPQLALQSVPSYVDPSNSGNAVSLNSPSYFATNNNRGTVNSNGRLMQLPISPISHTASTPNPNAIPAQTSASLYGRPALLSGNQAPSEQVTLRPLSTFEEFMARLGYHNVTLATLPPLFPPNFTLATPFPPLAPSLHTKTSPAKNEIFSRGVASQQSQPDLYHRYPAFSSQQGSLADLDDTSLQRAGLRQF